MGGTDTRATVLDELIRNGEFGKIVASHLRLDLNGVENLLRSKPKSHHQEPKQTYREKSGYLSVVDTNDATNHFRNDDHVTEMCLYDSRLLIWRCLLLSLTQLFDKTHRTTCETTLEPSARTSMNQANELYVIRRRRSKHRGIARSGSQMS